MTIHQPNSDIYELFDRLILMVEGKFIYQGDAEAAPDYFASKFGLIMPDMTNPADYFMNVMHQEDPANVRRYPAYFEAYNTHIAPVIRKAIENKNTDPVQKR